MTTLHAVIIAIVEGITEFLPISSTGHMILTEAFLGFKSTDFTKVFIVNIQFGAILSIIILYWKRFFQSLDFYFKLFVAFLPAAITGFLLIDLIDSLLDNVFVVAITMLLGGIILVYVDRWFKNDDEQQQTISYKTALCIGCFQCIAMVPGVSRSAATIIGGMTQKLSRKASAEFSFFLAVPTMFAASAYKLLKTYKVMTAEHIPILVIGNIVAFLVALIAVKSFISFLTKYGFKLFGFYRIAVSIIILILMACGYDLSVH